MSDGLEEIASYVNNIILSMVMFSFLFLVVPFMVLAAPYIIILVGVRLATRGSNRVFVKLAEISQLITGELGYLIRRGISTGTRRIINLTTVLSVLFAFLVLTSTFTFSQQDMEERTIKTEVGSDMRIRFSNRFTLDKAEYLKENITQMHAISKDIDTIVPIFLLNSGFQVNKDSPVIIFLVDARAYSRITYFDSDIFEDGDEEDLRALQSGGAIISSDLAEEISRSRGDTINLERRSWDSYGGRPKITNFGSMEIRGVMKVVPGLYGSSDDESDEWILLDKDQFLDLAEKKLEDDDNLREDIRSRYALLHTASSADRANISLAIERMEQFNVKEVRIASSEIEEMNNEPTSDSFLLVLKTQLGVLIFISILASATVVFISSYEKRRERAAIMLRGTTSRQLHLLEYGEALVILVYSLIIGLTTGLIAGAVWIYVFNVFEDLEVINRSYWPSMAMLPVIGIMIVIFLVAVAVSTRMQRNIDLVKYMRWG